MAGASKKLSVDDLLNEDVAVLAMGVYLSMSKENMLAYWSRIFKGDIPGDFKTAH